MPLPHHHGPWTPYRDGDPPIPWAAYAIAQLSFGGEIIPNIQPGSS